MNKQEGDGFFKVTPLMYKMEFQRLKSLNGDLGLEMREFVKFCFGDAPVVRLDPVFG